MNTLATQNPIKAMELNNTIIPPIIFVNRPNNVVNNFPIDVLVL